MNKYVEYYNQHYVLTGESGSGQLVWQPQYEIWLKAGYKPSMSVLDYGCGVGIMLEADIKDYLGVDISKEAVRLARKRYPDNMFAVFEMGKLPPLHKNVCVAQSVFTHTPFIYVDKCLKDIKRNFQDFAIIDILIGEDDPMDYHVRRYAEDVWLDYVWKAGLKAERIGEHDFVGYNHVYYKIS